MPTLHPHPLSASSRFVRLVLAEYGEQVELREEAPLARNEALLAMNPAGTLPVFVDSNEATISEGWVIAEYLTETRTGRTGEESLLPINPVERAETRRLVSWFGQKMNGEVTRLLVNELVLKRLAPTREGGGAPDSVAIRAGRTNIRYHLRYIGYLAERRDWLGGRRLSLADLAAAAEISCLDYMGEVPWNEDEAAKNWYARVKSRPSFRPLLADRLKGANPSPHYTNPDF